MSEPPQFPLLSVRWSQERGWRFIVGRNCVAEREWRRLEHIQAMSAPERHEHHRLNAVENCPVCDEGRSGGSPL